MRSKFKRSKVFILSFLNTNKLVKKLCGASYFQPACLYKIELLLQLHWNQSCCCCDCRSNFNSSLNRFRDSGTLVHILQSIYAKKEEWNWLVWLERIGAFLTLKESMQKIFKKSRSTRRYNLIHWTFAWWWDLTYLDLF